MWPELPYDKWKDTLDTLHMWMQIVGKVKLELAPFINQWWEVAFYITPSGMTSGNIPYKGEIFTVDFNFINHTLSIHTSTNKEKIIPFRSQTVAAFYEEFMNALKDLEIHVEIWPVPVEVADTTPFNKDTKHASYDKEYVTRWWRILVHINMIFDKFRSSFRGKSSPIHFFWGSFDLSGTRFSGKIAAPPQMKGSMGRIMRYAENEENFAFGFWPGDLKLPFPALYSYMYPAPQGMKTIRLDQGASFNEQLGECILPYDVVRKAANPEKSIWNFLETTYTESAKLAGWDIKSLQGKIPT